MLFLTTIFLAAAPVFAAMGTIEVEAPAAITRGELAEILDRWVIPAYGSEVSVHWWACFDDTFTNGGNPNDPGYVIERVHSYSLMLGDGDGRFRPDDVATQAEIAMILCRVAGIDPARSVLTISDAGIAIPRWAEGSVGLAVQLLSMGGYSPTWLGEDEEAPDYLKAVNVFAGRWTAEGTGLPRDVVIEMLDSILITKSTEEFKNLPASGYLFPVDFGVPLRYSDSN